MSRLLKHGYLIFFIFLVVTSVFEASRFNVADGNLGVNYPLWSYRLFASAPRVETIYDVIIYSDGVREFPEGLVIKNYFSEVNRGQRMPVHRSIYHMAEYLQANQEQEFQKVKQVFEQYVFKGQTEHSYALKKVLVDHMKLFEDGKVENSETIYCVGDLACEK